MPLVTLHDGTRLRYRQEGDARHATPAVLVHGAGTSAAVWTDTLRRLGRKRRAVAIDLPGHGQSEGGTEPTLDHLRDALGMTAAKLCLGPSVLIGHSLGGPIVLDAALTWPDKVAALVLVATGARLQVPDAIFKALARFDLWPEVAAELFYSPKTPAAERRAMARAAFTADQTVTTADLRLAAATDLAARLASIQTPALIVSGADDLLTPPAAGASLAALLPRATHVTIADAGHMPMQEKPAALADAIGTFLDGLPRTP